LRSPPCAPSPSWDTPTGSAARAGIRGRFVAKPADPAPSTAVSPRQYLRNVNNQATASPQLRSGRRGPKTHAISSRRPQLRADCGRLACACSWMMVLARLDWREARRQADLLHAMGFGRKTPMGQQEQVELLAKVDQANRR